MPNVRTCVFGAGGGGLQQAPAPAVFFWFPARWLSQSPYTQQTKPKTQIMYPRYFIRSQNRELKGVPQFPHVTSMRKTATKQAERLGSPNPNLNQPSLTPLVWVNTQIPEELCHTASYHSRTSIHLSSGRPGCDSGGDNFEDIRTGNSHSQATQHTNSPALAPLRHMIFFY